MAGWLGLSLVPTTTSAAENKGLAVSPAFQQLKVAADQPRVEYVLTLRNQSDVAQPFRLSAVDFGSLDESGGVAFLGQPANELEHKYGLAAWMVLEQTNVTVPPGKAVQIKAAVDNRASLAPGGHYGAVLATALTEGGPGANTRVGVKQVLSSLVLVSKDGGAAPEVKLVSQSPNGGAGKLPTRMDYRFQNVGNVHVVPRGVTHVRDPRGKTVARTALNSSSGAILPESFRRYSEDLQQLESAWLPGRYAVVTTYRYEGTEATKDHVTYFWYAGTVAVWGGAAAAIAALGLAGWWLWRRYRR